MRTTIRCWILPRYDTNKFLARHKLKKEFMWLIYYVKLNLQNSYKFSPSGYLISWYTIQVHIGFNQIQFSTTFVKKIYIYTVGWKRVAEWTKCIIIFFLFTIISWWKKTQKRDWTWKWHTRKTNWGTYCAWVSNTFMARVYHIEMTTKQINFILKKKVFHASDSWRCRKWREIIFKK